MSRENNGVEIEEQSEITRDIPPTGCSWTKRKCCLPPSLLGFTVLVVCFVYLIRSQIPTHLDNAEITPEALPILLRTKTGSNDGQDSKGHNMAADDICLTRGCVHAASKMISKMDETIDPCEDFFTFSCGTFIRNSVIPDKKSAILQHRLVQDETNAKLRQSLRRKYDPNSPHFEKLAKSLYSECMNTSKIEEDGLMTLKDMLALFGGWPVVEGDVWNPSDFSWINFVNTSRQLGFSHSNLIGVRVYNSLSNSFERITYLDQPSFGISLEYLRNGETDPQIQGYLKFSIDAAILFGANPQRAQEEMKQALNFEMALANISALREDRRNLTKLNNVMPISELTSTVPGIDWLDYLNMLLPSSVKLEDSENVLLYDIDFLRNFTQLCQNTPNRTIANYLIWRLVKSSATHLSEEIRKLELEYLERLTGQKSRDPRWEECVKFVSGGVPLAVGSLYIRDYFNEESKRKSVETFDYVKNEFNNILRSIPWMDNITRKAALEKASAMKSHIAYPIELLSDASLDDFYANMPISGGGSHLMNQLKINKFNTDFKFGELHKSVNKSDWKLNGEAAVVNAFYSGTENSMKFPAAFLQEPYFDKDRPRYMNFGGIAYVIGHEITHGFDDWGRQYNKNGDLFNWWEEETLDKFVSLTKCFIWQYGNYTVPENGLNLNGINTQGENIADNGGIKEAYYAYKQWVKHNSKESPLPGLTNYTTEQLFWISFAQLHCSKHRPDDLKKQVLTGYHSPGRFRTIGSVSNMDEFSSDWNCPVGSRMNPTQKCQLW